MKFNENLIRTFNKVKNKAEINSPEILVGIGIAAFAATLYYTVKGTVTASEAISCSSEELDSMEDENPSEERAIKLRCASDVAKAYAPAVICGSITLASFLSSNRIMANRAINTAAAYTALETGFSEYRKRVIDKYGESADREFKYGIVEKKVKTSEIDPETGKKVKKTETVDTIEQCGPFGIYFKPEYYVKKTGKTIKNLNWQPDTLFNITFLNAQQAWFNGKLDRGERVYLSEVLKALNIPEDDYPDSRVNGWTPKGEGDGDHYIRFNAYNPPYSNDYVVNDDGEILLDFNTDGVILYK